MEHDGRRLDVFSNSINTYLNEILIKKNYVSSTLRKHNVKNEEDVDFSFVLRRAADLSCEDKSFFSQIGFRLSEEIVKLTSEESQVSDLTEYRCTLLKVAAQNILQASGYNVSAEEGDPWVHLATDPRNQEDSNLPKRIQVCGPVLDAKTKLKDTVVQASDYRLLCLADLKKKSRNNSEKNDEQLLESLTDAVVKINFLQCKPSQAIFLNLNLDSVSAGEMGSKGGIFLQYNASRLVSLRTKYSENVARGKCPPLPDPDEVDFGVLEEPEEWSLLFDFLLEYPSLVDKIARDTVSGKVNLHHMCKFLLKFCSVFSAYYRRVRILLVPKPHLLATIHARILLILSVEQVLENGLAIFNIKKAEKM